MRTGVAVDDEGSAVAARAVGEGRNVGALDGGQARRLGVGVHELRGLRLGVDVPGDGQAAVEEIAGLHEEGGATEAVV